MTSIIQNSSPVDTVKAFIACIRTKDLESMRKIIHPQATACLIRENEPRFLALTEAIDALEYATVWATFSMHRDGEASDPFSSR